MSVGYYLINKTKKEQITFSHLPAETARELTGNPVTSAITTWYMLKNLGDDISFIPDQYYENESSLKEASLDEILGYNDMTNLIIEDLIGLRILKDNGIEHFFEDEPEVYIRRLENVWMDEN
ncbi:hypothetical protein [Clostridium saccharoperbutylacetonicum]|uniref:Uncharacterized protein n=1 Tax=Clostridium saccharoperbutylacetonicum N1-4(HMT) TaxID=931276 RepID=M1MWW0_9CLOT|nr:hypothetical protein [Clostridium saccharoperbutylacetonicum]AGF55957.1 hypothetical protein Cspa_c21920 [Clostridium saccharoperbutylacetonicum N1-4(HMT)]AQR94699.1 hypothetical protein CLSAP_20130 [Clostridium saccharoperbutylacetonicum]NRT63304.1 hypothetical protein [Clostridium saccharoperbutylacetonicum]NSB26666.1 hypothetical protein [Clostridium saccharoperbutylacetonicum]NSB30540.1 hypothetical protein [Clostridium saccharoperbutylacetonicum]